MTIHTNESASRVFTKYRAFAAAVEQRLGRPFLYDMSADQFASLWSTLPPEERNRVELILDKDFDEAISDSWSTVQTTLRSIWGGQLDPQLVQKIGLHHSAHARRSN